MKLTNFLDDPAWNNLRAHMKAQLVNFTGDVSWTPIDKSDLLTALNEGGIEVALQEVQIDSDGSFVYQGHKVLVYIKDQRYHPTHGDKSYRFHLCNCQTIDEFASKNRLDRYVVSRRTDGMFLINIYNVVTRTYEKEGLYRPMKVCKNCLMRLGYKGYQDHYKDVGIFNNFDLTEYFELYKDSQFTYVPAHDAESAPKDDYSQTFPEISRLIRQENGWRCSDCTLPLVADKNFLHVHHQNGIKSDNSKRNLKPVCIGCHSLKPGHDRLKFQRELIEFMKKYGDEWTQLRNKLAGTTPQEQNRASR